MSRFQQPIRQDFDTGEVDYADLQLLRDHLNKNKPELLRSAAEEFLTAKRRLEHLIGVIDRHLRALDEHWTTGNDAKTVKAELRRLRAAASDVSTTISNQPVDAEQCPANPSGVAPALLLQAHTLSVFSGKNLPESADRDVSVLEGAFQGGAVGTIGGGVIGGPPGAVIGAVVGTLAGGVTALFTDGPFANLVGDSKEEKDRKAAKEHIKLLTEATNQNNQAFPVELNTDIPQFSPLAPRTPTIPDVNGPGGGTVPAGLGQGLDPGAPGIDGLGYPTGQDGLTDPSLHRIPGVDTTYPGGTLPDGSAVGATPGGGTGLGGTNGAGGAGGANLPGGQGADVPATNVPGAGGTSPNAPQTSLAGLGDPAATLPQVPSTTTPALNAAATNVPATGIGSPYGGSSVGGAFGNGAAAGAASAAGRGASGRAPTVPVVPPVGARGKGKEDAQETTRTTWLLEDDSLFASDVPTINPTLKGESKGKA
ncbi:PE-PGRS virulence associated protein [[Actinomadura] parvosata subsp. kistnae]|uniref:Uncharacterized protein n=1 Tax=[Actinomadura] parvosata subsp. kistnae TaxID=1909395 RepID=A0A1V0A911_9ACTN|nr:hypothetical protein [Nonomuraea sp. ATCC 55076]AQZ66688.1 hypothetical protein BKM31_39280 [Nonomuraea sp. ATCC 55076]SPL95201.1 PE-PGRS virulence associated protein [Actinomadura parvosata subsp. kistnae]